MFTKRSSLCVIWTTDRSNNWTLKTMWYQQLPWLILPGQSKIMASFTSCWSQIWMSYRWVDPHTETLGLLSCQIEPINPRKNVKWLEHPDRKRIYMKRFFIEFDIKGLLAVHLYSRNPLVLNCRLSFVLFGYEMNDNGFDLSLLIECVVDSWTS